MKDRLLKFAKNNSRPLSIAAAFALIGILLLINANAAGIFISTEPENGAATGVTVGSDNQASGGKYVKFGSDSKPNIVYVLLDDMDSKVLPYLTKAKSLVADQGMTFNNYMFNLSICCPSRASMLRGQYAHNTKVMANGKPNGGYNQFIANGNETSTMATWLKSAGYKTAYMGKYMNGYPDGADLPATHVPAGWDKWFATTNGFYDQYNYDINDNGTILHRGAAEQDYATDVLAAEAQEYLDVQATSSDPFLMLLSPPAPHKPYEPAARHKNLFNDVTYPKTDSFDETNVSDKPQEIQVLPRIGPNETAKIDEAFRNRIRSVQAVDEMIEALVNKLQAQGKLANTVFLVGSDNGYHMGEHRMQGNEDKSEPDDGIKTPGGKHSAYVEDIRVPLYIRGPGISAGQQNNKLVSVVDLAPTFADFGGATIPSFVDGRSFAPLARGENPAWRTSFLIQRWEDRLPFYGVYTETSSYVHYHTGEIEYYNLIDDPIQNKNKYGTPEAPKLLTDPLESRALQLTTCSGQTCRDIEQQAL